MQSIGNAIAGFFLAVALVIFIIVGYNLYTRQLDFAQERLEFDQTVAERQAYDACWEAARVEVQQDTGLVRQEPLMANYVLCLEDKGLDTNFESDS